MLTLLAIRKNFSLAFEEIGSSWWSAVELGSSGNRMRPTPFFHC
jgi:hypothetical protein